MSHVWKTYSEEIRIKAALCDASGALTPGHLLALMQEVAGTHSELIGVGRAALAERGMAWVLTRLEVEMDRWPAVGETVSLETFHGPARRWLFPRYFALRDASGREIGRAASLWVLMDLASRRMARPDAVLSLMPDNSDLIAPLHLPGPVTEVGGTVEAAMYRPQYTDLDINGHVNNTKYLDWCCNALGIATMTDSEMAHFSVNYDLELRPGQEVRTELRRFQDAFSFSGFVGESRHFDVGGTLRPRRKN